MAKRAEFDRGVDAFLDPAEDQFDDDVGAALGFSRVSRPIRQRWRGRMRIAGTKFFKPSGDF